MAQSGSHTDLSEIKHRPLAAHCFLVARSNAFLTIVLLQFCRFCSSLVRLGMLVPTMDAEIAQVLRFSLRHSRYREANALYRAITTVRNEGGGG
jgi:hypothetical protein